MLGDVPHYVEPFFGSGAVLLNRPHPANRTYSSETVNDLDGFVANFWRAVQWYPAETARAASWPVVEVDKTARQIALLRWRESGGRDRLAGDAAYCDPVMAGWWAWAVSCQIGAFDGRSGWTADRSTGMIYRQDREAREPGVRRDRPHLSSDGQGVNHANAREPGVTRNLPHLSNDGRGVNRPQAREPGVLDPPGPEHGMSALDDWGHEYHDIAMPELIRWFRHLCARLRHVRVLNGDWSRLVTTGAAHTLPVRHGDGPAGVFLDPPYADTAGRASSLYAQDSEQVAHKVRDWCLANGDNPKFRVVLAGYDTEHDGQLEAAGWTAHEWFTTGFLSGGMGNTKRTDSDAPGVQQDRERLWASPHCLTPTVETQGALFG